MMLNFKEIYKISLGALYLTGIHPSIRRDKKWALHFLLLHGSFLIMFIILVYGMQYQFFNGLYTELCGTATMAVVFVVVSIQYTIGLVFQDDLRELMETIIKDYEAADELDDTERNLVVNYAMRGRWMSKMWLVVISLTGVLFPMKAFILMSYYGVRGKFRLVPLYDLFHPDIMEAQMNNGVAMFVFWFSFSWLYNIYACTVFIGFEALAPMFVIHACGQLEIVSYRIYKLFLDENDNRKRVELIKVIAKHLIHIYRYIDKVNQIFRVLYELLLKACEITIPVTAYLLLEGSRTGNMRLEYINFAVASLVLCYVPCYYSSLLTEKGENVRLAMYQCGWETQRDLRTRNSLLILLTRALRPTAISTIFHNIDLDTFSDACHHAYALFNLLNTMWT